MGDTYTRPERSTLPEHTWIVGAIGINGATVMPSDNGGWLWLRVSRHGHSWSHRLPVVVAEHHIAAAKREYAAWLEAEEISE
jgi:hypothetical protein